MRRLSIIWALLSALIISCSGDAPNDCAFQAQDGSCAVTQSSDGSLVCTLHDQAMCATITAFLQSGEHGAVRGSSAALVNTGARIGRGGGLAEVCEPDGTFMCTCCDVKAGCYPCPKKDPVFAP